jgi:Ca2+-binding EF-hand superfamily protein
MSDEKWRNDLVKTFAKFDADDNGRIDRAEFDSLLDALGSKMSKDDRDTGFKIVDVDGDGHITCDELATWWDVVREEGQ